MDKIYRIVNQEGLESTGGFHPVWRKVGKSWNSAVAVRRHLNRAEQLRDWPYKNCRIWVWELQEVLVECSVIDGFYKRKGKNHE